jgi:hypothetical protein
MKCWGQYLELNERTLLGAGESIITRRCFMVVNILVIFIIETTCMCHQTLFGWLGSKEMYAGGVHSNTTETGPINVPPPYLLRSTNLLASTCFALFPFSHLGILFKHIFASHNHAITFGSGKRFWSSYAREEWREVQHFCCNSLILRMREPLALY